MLLASILSLDGQEFDPHAFVYEPLDRYHAPADSDPVFCAYHRDYVTEQALFAAVDKAPESMKVNSRQFGRELHIETEEAKCIVAVFRIRAICLLVHIVAEAYGHAVTRLLYHQV